MDCSERIEKMAGKLREKLEKISDKRKARGKRYKLASLLSIMVLGKMSGEDSIEGIAEWGRLRQAELSQALGIKGERLPHASTYRRVLGNKIEVSEVEAVVNGYLQELGEMGTHLALDGKMMRGTQHTNEKEVYLLALYATKGKVVVAESEIGGKGHELTAAPALLQQVTLAHKVVSGDANFAQRNLSEQVVAAGGHYVWTLKGNQGQLHNAVRYLFDPPADAPPLLTTDFAVATDNRKGHGRREKRTLTTSALLNPSAAWPHLAQVFRIERHFTSCRSGKVTHEVAFGMTSLPATHASPARLLALVRRHWAIENSLHYVRDVTFHEDKCRLATRSAAHTIAIFNNLICGLLAQLGFRSIPQARRFFNAHLSDALRLVVS